MVEYIDVGIFGIDFCFMKMVVGLNVEEEECLKG